MRMRTRHKGTLTAGCKPVEWVVAIKNGKDPAGQARNLRRIKFVNKDADSVFVVNPVILPKGTKDARGVRVNCYADTRGTKYAFLEKVKLPATLYVEGLRTSSKVKDIGFEYQFFKGDKALCGASALGTVVDVKADFDIPRGSGAEFEDHRKMLVRSSGSAKVEPTPAIRVDARWTYRNEEKHFKAPKRKSTSFTAPNQVSGARAGENVLLRLDPKPAALKGQIIEATLKATCTAPTRVQLAKPFTPPGATPLLAPRAKFSLDLFNFLIEYEMLDQFGAGITLETAWGGAVPVCRENIAAVLRSPIARVNTYIRRKLRHTPNWKRKSDGQINDRIKVRELPNTVLTEVVKGQRRFVRPLLRRITPNGPLLMDLGRRGTHNWFVGVHRKGKVYDGRGLVESLKTGQGAGFPQVTANTFNARVVGRQAVGAGARPIVSLSFRGFYTVVLR